MKQLLAAIAILFLLSRCSPPATKPGISIKPVKVDSAAVPKDAKYKGSLDTAVSYTDSQGDHLILTSEDYKEQMQPDSENYRSAYIFVYSYKITGGKAKLDWKIYDAEEDCTFDITSHFLPKTFAVTDLNNDGVAEVWIMYKNACRSDVSGSDMKVIMHQGAKKYAMRGECRVKVNGTDFDGGKYTFDEAFKNGPETFRKYALKLWNANVNETDFGM